MSTSTQVRAPAADTSTVPARPPKSRRRSGSIWFLAPAIVFTLLTVVYPLLYNISQSFFDVGLREVVSGGARWVGLDNYRDQFGREEFWRSFAISLGYSAATVALTFTAGLVLALLFHRFFPGRNVLRALLLLAWILPTVVSANVWRWMLDGSYGLLNAGLQGLGLQDKGVFWLGNSSTAIAAVTVATAWSFAPFAMILLSAGLQGIPSTLYEAARIDGASTWQQFRYVTLPVLRPVSLTAALLCFIFTFKTFDTIFLMTGGGPGGATRILPVYAYNEAFKFSRFDTAAVATTVLMVVPFVLSIFYYRALRSEEAA